MSSSEPHRPAPSPATPRPRISLTQVASSALAAASAAFAASFLGVAGTIIGAAVGSVVATVAGATYAASLQRSREAVRLAAARVRPYPATGAPQHATLPDSSVPVAEPPAAQGAEEDAAPGLSISWRTTALTAAAVLAITIGAVTTVEAALGKPLAGLFGHDDASGTSIGSTFDRGPAPEHRDRTPRQDTPTSVPTETPSGMPTAPSAAPTDAPTAPTDPTGSPAVPTAPADPTATPQAPDSPLTPLAPPATPAP